jgi:hypothetical protein
MTTATDLYHAHLDDCGQCMNQPFNLCPTGAALLTDAAIGPTAVAGPAAEPTAEATPPKRRVWLIGESNPYGSDPEFDLWPGPRGCAGWRLCVPILGLDPDDYVATFERRNLLRAARWSAPRAREAAVEVERDFRAAGGCALVLLGAKVAAAFGFLNFKSEMLHPALTTTAGSRALVIPHPSGLSRLWNEPGVTERVCAAVLALVRAAARSVTECDS